MQITEVRIKLMDDPHDRLQAFCSVTFDECFVIRDLKIIQGTKGSFVAMPSRKLTDRCPCCGTKNHLRSQHCNQCGTQLNEDRALKDDEGRAKLYADIAHPINSQCREMIQAKVLEAFELELVKAKEPGYVCTYDDYGEDRIAALRHPEEHSPASAPNESSTVQVMSNGQSRRFESAGQNGHTGPHQGTSHSGDHQSDYVRSGATHQSEESGDTFDDGLL